MKKIRNAAVVLTMAVVGLCFASEKPNRTDSLERDKIKLVFVIDQGFSNGVVVMRDTVRHGTNR